MYDHPETAWLLFQKVTDYYYEVSRNIFEAASIVHRHLFHRQRFRLPDRAAPGRGSLRAFRDAFPSPPDRSRPPPRAESDDALLRRFPPLFPSLIGAGLDGVHALQPFCAGMEPSGLKRDFGDGILPQRRHRFAACADRRNADLVRERPGGCSTYDSPGGGYVAGARPRLRA